MTSLDEMVKKSEELAKLSKVIKNDESDIRKIGNETAQMLSRVKYSSESYFGIMERGDKDQSIAARYLKSINKNMDIIVQNFKTMEKYMK